MAIHIISEPSKHGFEFRVTRDRALGSPIQVPLSEWVSVASPSDLAGISQLVAWVDDDVAVVQGDRICVPHKVIANLSSNVARLVCVPPPVPYVLDIQHMGTIDRPDFRFKTTWLLPNGQAVPGATRVGAALLAGSRFYRISEPLFEIIEACEAFNAISPEQNMDGRFKQWARLSGLLPSETDRSVRLDGYLSSTRIAHASSFSLSLQSGAQGFTFDPVLFGPELRHGDDFTPSELEGLLPPAQQAKFAGKRFRDAGNCQPHYALGDGWYVVLDEPVQLALNVVRRAQLSDAETRKQFARNPRAFLNKELAEDLPANVLESAFVETAEFSGRVRDVGIWQPKVLPWIQKPTEKWIPAETFGIRVGQQYIKLEPKDVPKLEEQVLNAIKQGEANVTWDNIPVPAQQETLDILKALVREVRPESGKSSGLEEEPAPFKPEKESEQQPKPRSDKYVLEIYDHFSEVGFQRGRLARPFTYETAAPVRLRTPLKPHQGDGLMWLQKAWLTGLSGVLLADDMGLGKTLQALAFLVWLREAMETHRKRTPVLIVAPTGLLKNWEQEHDKHLHAPGLGSVVRAFGSGLATLRTQKGSEIELGEAILDHERLAQADWVLTTYETLRDYQHSFCAIRYAAVVFDEMQKVKTPGIAMTDAAKALNADFIVGLTGTPVENRLADLWCIVDTLQPGILADLAGFSRKYERDEKLDELAELKRTLCEPASDAPQIMLRRMKADKLPGLPPKIEHLMEEIMSDTQASAYAEAVKAAQSVSGQSKMLETLHRLRSISLHPFHPDTSSDDKYIKESARFVKAISILDHIADKGEKALIFLESQEMQPYLAGLLQRRYKLKSLPMLINGTISGAKRQQRVDQFQSSPRGFDVIILSPRAGGVGLTLTAANHVVHLSRWWNPAVEDQCTDRVHRIGQTAKEVHVYYPMALHPDYREQSFDRRLHALLERRRQLSRELLMPPTDPNNVKDLFDQTVGATSQTKVDLDAIDSMEPIEFENWILGRLRDAGHRVSRTPKTRDGGADGLFYHRTSGRPYLIQCKHTQVSAYADHAVDDLVRAKRAYNLNGSGFVAVTNAKAFGRAAANIAQELGIQLITGNDLEKWPAILG